VRWATQSVFDFEALLMKNAQANVYDICIECSTPVRSDFTQSSFNSQSGSVGTVRSYRLHHIRYSQDF